MANRRRPAKFHLARVSASGTAAEISIRGPEHIDVSEERGSPLHLLTDPGEGLLLRLRQRGALRGEIVGHLLQRALISRDRRIHELDEPALVKLFAMGANTKRYRFVPSRNRVRRTASRKLYCTVSFLYFCRRTQ
jgi:hypothetical protein